LAQVVTQQKRFFIGSSCDETLAFQLSIKFSYQAPV